jgi:hypothetical protein
MRPGCRCGAFHGETNKNPDQRGWPGFERGGKELERRNHRIP